MIDKECTVRGRVVQQQLENSANKGTPGIALNCRVTSGEFENQYARFNGWFTENTTERIVETLIYCGWEGDDLSEFADGALHGLDKNEVELVIRMEEYQGTDEKHLGKSFPRIAFINKIGGRGLNVEAAMKPQEAAAFGAKMKGLVLKTRAKSGSNGAGSTDFPHGANLPAASGEKRF